jgi:hypothetical protein
MSIALRICHRKQRAKSVPYILGLKAEVLRRNGINECLATRSAACLLI